MNFASKYIYAYESPEYEYVSDEEYDHGMSVSGSSGSDDDDDDEGEIGSKALPELAGVPPPPPPPAAASASSSMGSARKARAKKPKKALSWKTATCMRSLPPRVPTNRKFRRADTNVVSIKLNELVAPSNMHAGDPVHCTKCQAILSKLAKVVSDGTDKVWQCDFCGERNLVDVEEEEIPGTDDVTFLVEPAPATAATGPSGLDESLVIFCVDISGSMCVTTEVPGKLNLRGSSRLRRMMTFNDTHEDQYLPRQRRDMTYVSRLQAVQAAVDHQLGEMQKDHSSRRVGLITFDNEVTVIGDGTEEETTVVGDKLKSKESLSELGTGLNLPKPIKETRKSLGDKLFSLEEGGATALGPALVVAVSMASRHPGSKVIICTDGMANVGMGKLEEAHTQTETETEEENFYESIGTTAMEKGVAISVVTIKGTDCKLVELGKLADRTGGQVNIVDPLKLTEEFSNILADRIIATNVVATFILHKQLFIDDVDEDKKESRAVREVGNVTCNTEITFEYGVRSEKPETTPEAKPASQEISDAGAGAGPSTSTDVPTSATGKEQSTMPDELPFQLQICYTDTEGMKALRVLTQTRPVTRDRNLAEESVDLNVLGTNAAQKTANLAIQGEYTLSRGAALMNQRLAWRSAQKPGGGGDKKAWYRRIFSKIQTVENHVTKAQMSERSRFGSTYSDEEDSCVEPTGTKCKKKRAKKSKARTSEIADEMANDVYTHTHISSNKLN